MKRLLVLALLVIGGLGVVAPPASAIPVCVQYNDPVHMGSYPVCPLSWRP